MEVAEMKIAVVLAWALIWSVIAVPFATSLGSWVVLAGSGVLPALMIAWTWQSPALVVPAVIGEARK